MDTILRTYVRIREASGQTMTEYALIMAAIAVACFAAYNLLGDDINTLVNKVKADL